MHADENSFEKSSLSLRALPKLIFMIGALRVEVKTGVSPERLSMNDLVELQTFIRTFHLKHCAQNFSTTFNLLLSE